VLEKMIVLERSQIIREARLPKQRADNGWETETRAENTPLFKWIKDQEKQYLIRKLSMCGGRIDLTARSCHVGVRTLARKMRSHGLDKRQFESAAAKPASLLLPPNH
jgi:DNA-binding NtrC family response regulator